MGILDIFRKKSAQKRSLDKFYSGDFITLFEKMQSGALSPEQASQIATVYACEIAICESLAMIPIKVFREEKSGGYTQVDDHPVAILLDVAPNGFQDAFQYKETGQLHILERGNFFSAIERNGVSEIGRLVPLLPENVTVIVEEGRLVYKYKYFTKDKGWQEKLYPHTAIFHIKNRSRDGVLGQSPLVAASKSVSFSHHLLQHGTSMFENGAFLSGLLSVPFEFEDDEQRERFVQSFKQVVGSQNAGKIGLLEKGAEFKELEMTAQEAQFIESKQFSVTEIARIFRVPPHMVQDLSNGASYSSIEQQSINFVQHTIQPWATRWEYAAKNQLFDPKKESNFYVRFDIDELIRGDLKSRTEAVVQQLKYGLLTINEGREMLDRNPTKKPIGEDLFVDQNMVPADKIGEVPSLKIGDERNRAVARVASQLMEGIRAREVAFFSSKRGQDPEKRAEFLKNHPEFMASKLESIAFLRNQQERDSLVRECQGYTEKLSGLVSLGVGEELKSILDAELGELWGQK